jgi:hypothetical protein
VGSAAAAAIASKKKAVCVVCAATHHRTIAVGRGLAGEGMPFSCVVLGQWHMHLLHSKSAWPGC